MTLNLDRQETQPITSVAVAQRLIYDRVLSGF